MMMFPNYQPYPNYYNPYMSVQPATFRGQQIQGGFVRVPSEDVARSWNVMPGTSVTFLDENRPYCYTKTVDVSQLDRPRFEKYRLVKEEDVPAADVAVRPQEAPQGVVPGGGCSNPEYALKSDVAELREVVEALKRRIDKEVENNGKPVD